MAEKSVVITGTSRGIGFHLANRFLSEGYGVIGISRSQTPIAHPKFKQIISDLSQPKEVNNLTNELKNYSICGLINNAGIHGPIGAFETIDFNDWIETFNTNIFSAAILSQICIPSLRSTRGFIIFLSGGGSAFPRAFYSAYGVSKCAVIRLADTLAVELMPDVLVYCVAPGPNRTTLLEEARQSGDQIFETEIVDFEYPENLCLFLAGNKDPRYSGKFIHVKDGYENWNSDELSEEAFTLRRIDPRTLSKINF